MFSDGETILILQNPSDFYLASAKIIFRCNNFYIEYDEAYPGATHLWACYDTIEKCKRFVARHYGGEGKRTKWEPPSIKEQQ